MPLPAALARSLVAMQPPPGDGIRRSRAEDLHLTLHFIGRAAVAPVRTALATIDAAAFRLTLERPGHFGLRGRKRVLWVGIRPAPGLTALHAAVGEALRSTGFEPERRRYLPHVTLARLGPDVADGVVEAFEQAAVPDEAASFACDRFALYASRTLPEGARYRILASFALG